jgi:DNA-binding NarL/FixJ family response regulator
MNLEVTSVAKKEQKQGMTAAAIFVITQEEIRRSGVTSIPEALRLAPGVEVSRIDANNRRGQFQGREGDNPAVVLLDLKLPKVPGLDVLRQIKTTEKLKTTPVVILTSSREDRDLIETYTLGVNAYVVKPVDFRAFLDAVKTLGVFWAVINEPPPRALSEGP